MENVTHPDLLVGLLHGDDAAVWRRPDGRALVATVDFFTPIVDDAATWGAISAANSASDVYAMGAVPLFALNIVVWPRDVLPLELLGEVLAGASSVAAEGGWVVVGGHTVDGPEPMFGQVVIGETSADHILSNVGARPGDALVLTKPIGTGVISTAMKRLPFAAPRLAVPVAAAVASMTTLNASAARQAVDHHASACTDVTGFGLAGHVHKMALGSGLALDLDVDAVGLLPDIHALIDEGYVPGGTHRNLSWLEPFLVGGTARDRLLVADPQTSGGLAYACSSPPDDAMVIGRFTDGPPGQIRLGHR